MRMRSEADREELRHLEERIQECAAEVKRVRRSRRTAPARPAASLAAAWLVFLATGTSGVPLWGAVLIGLGAGGAVPGAFGLAGDVMARLHRSARGLGMRRELQRLPAREATKTLLRYEHHSCPDTRAGVAPLLRRVEFLNHEMAPASEPEGTGDEVTPGSEGG